MGFLFISLFLFPFFLLILGETGCERETQNPVLVLRPQRVPPRTYFLRVIVTLDGAVASNPVDFVATEGFEELDLRLPSDRSGAARIDAQALDEQLEPQGRATAELEIPGVGRHELRLPFAAEQEGWLWCHKCQGLYFSLNPTSACPAGGQHEAVQSLSYRLAHGETLLDTQEGFRWCRKCQGLHYAQESGVCPKDLGLHDSSGSFSYVLRTRQEHAETQQPDWSRCSACSGIFFRENPTFACPARPNGHLTDNNSHLFIDHR